MRNHLAVDGCHASVDAVTATAVCNSIGARLCSESELRADETRGTGCGFDAKAIWSASRGACRPGSMLTVAGNSLFDHRLPPTCTPMGQKSSARCATRPAGDIGHNRVAARGKWLPAHRANLQVEKALPFRRCCADASGNAANVQTPGGSAVDSSFFACDELGWRNASCLRAPKCNETASILFSAACKPGSDCWRIENRSVCPTRDARPVNSSSLVRFLPVSQYLLELASGVWVLECGVLTSREA